MAGKRPTPIPHTPALPPGRRAVAPGEHLFLGPTHVRQTHLWMTTALGKSGAVVACARCGLLRPGETLPERWEAITR